MLCIYCIDKDEGSQGFEVKTRIESEDKKKIAIVIEKKTKKEVCPHCGGKLYINELAQIVLRDMPYMPGSSTILTVSYYRYQCTCCNKTLSDEIPFRYPGTRITRRAAKWIKAFLMRNMSVRSIQQITGIHWDTIHKVHKDMIDKALEDREQRWKETGYKPRLLAVDEFAIHKGQVYATCVLDLETGEALWVGKGRAKADFAMFFEEIPADFLSEVRAVAMDMNASYNILVRERLPHAEIVYDRFHMQSQYGKDVLGVVRLAQAREHKAHAETVAKRVGVDASPEEKRAAKKIIKEEKKQYQELKHLRWPLLTNREKLHDKSTEHLDAILHEHAELATCYALKEEFCRLFSLRDASAAALGWGRWFDAALQSNIQPLARFATLKLQRIPGLIAHASYPISTGKLEGFNNKIKLIKRIAFGYRDESFFFDLVKFFSLRTAVQTVS